MTLEELRQRLLARLAELVEPAFKLTKRDRTFWKDAGPVRYALHISFINHADDFDVTVDVAIRHHSVEDVLNAERQLGPRERRETATVGAELGNLAGVGQHRWTVVAEGDVEPVALGIVDWFGRIGEPFLQRFASPAETLRVLEADGPEARMISPSCGHPTTGSRCIAATRSGERRLTRNCSGQAAPAAEVQYRWADKTHGAKIAATLLSRLLLVPPTLVAMASCSTELCPCHSGGASIMLPMNPSSPIATVSATSPCTTNWSTGSDWVLVMRQSAGACEVRFQAADGTTYASSVQFHGLGGCCPYTYSGTATPVEPVDAGTRG